MTKQEMIESIEKAIEGWLPCDGLAYPTRQMAESAYELITQTHHLVEKDKVEVVEGEPQEGDIVVYSPVAEMVEKYGTLPIYEKFNNNTKKNITEWIIRIIRRNGKPAINKEWVL